MRATRVALLVVSLALGAARAAEPLVLVADAQAARLAEAEYLIAYYGRMFFRRGTRVRSAAVQPDTPADRASLEALGGVTAFRLQSVCSQMAIQRGDEYATQEWTTRPAPNGYWSDDITFVHQTPRDRQTTVMLLSPPQPRSDVFRSAPVDDQRTFLHALGLGGRRGETPVETLDGEPVEIRRDSLRGEECLVLVTERTELWLAPDLGYAPLRQVRRWADAPRTDVEDLWGYQQAGALALPEYRLYRRVTREHGPPEIDAVILHRIALARCGQDEVERLAPEGWRVPLLVGSTVNDRRLVAGEPIPRLGYSPYDLWWIASEDGAAWGLSIEALAADVDLKLPDAPTRRAPG